MSAPDGSAATGKKKELPNWRNADIERFNATVAVAADALDLQPLTVEKDYWVCLALHSIETTYPGQVIFKGGTSLEKLRLIQRFSEDLDLLVTADVGGRSAIKTRLNAMADAAAAGTGGTLEHVGGGGNPGTMHRELYLRCPMEATAGDTDAFADPGRVLLEFGQTGGRAPSI